MRGEKDYEREKISLNYFLAFKCYCYFHNVIVITKYVVEIFLSSSLQS